MPNKKAKTKNVSPSKTKIKPRKATSVPKRGGILRTVGGALGGLLAGNAGAKIGSSIGGLASEIFGPGAYTVTNNSLCSSGEQGAPRFGNTLTGGQRIRHSEFISDVRTCVNFTNIVRSPINPGNSTLFPWLSTVATAFSEYRFHGLVFYYKTTSGTAVSSTSAALGTMIMATNYDPDAAAFTDKRDMEAYYYSTSCVPCTDMLHPIECKSGSTPTNRFYITTVQDVDGLPSNRDARLYYPGMFQCSSVGAQAISTTGELWVSYDIELDLPVINQNLAQNDNMAVTAYWTKPAGAPYFNTSPTFFTNTLGLLSSSVATSPSAHIYCADDVVYFLQPGLYQCQLYAWTAGSFTSGGTSPTCGNGAALNPVIYSSGAWQYFTFCANVSDTVAVVTSIVSVDRSWNRSLGILTSAPYWAPSGGGRIESGSNIFVTLSIQYLGRVRNVLPPYDSVVDMKSATSGKKPQCNEKVATDCKDEVVEGSMDVDVDLVDIEDCHLAKNSLCSSLELRQDFENFLRWKKSQKTLSSSTPL